MQETDIGLPGLPAITEISLHGRVISYKFTDALAPAGLYRATGCTNAVLKLAGDLYYEQDTMDALHGCYDRVRCCWFVPVMASSLPALLAFMTRLNVSMDRTALALLAAAAQCSCQDVLADLADGATERDREIVAEIAEGLI